MVFFKCYTLVAESGAFWLLWPQLSSSEWYQHNAACYVNVRQGESNAAACARNKEIKAEHRLLRMVALGGIALGGA